MPKTLRRARNLVGAACIAEVWGDDGDGRAGARTLATEAEVSDGRVGALTTASSWQSPGKREGRGYSGSSA
jgi:hypothetical protein